MNWDAIGAIGEIVGALAVVTTLLYLSVQVRQYQRSSIVEGSSKGHELHSAWRNTIVQNTEAAGALAKANNGESLSERDRVQLEFFADELFIASVVSDQFSRVVLSRRTNQEHQARCPDRRRAPPSPRTSTRICAPVAGRANTPDMSRESAWCHWHPHQARRPVDTAL